MELEKIAVFRKLGLTKETCSLDHAHDVTIYARKVLHLTDQKWLCDNGYERTVQPIYVDAQGREYRRVVTIDYFNNVYYTRYDKDGTATHWTTRPLVTGKLGRLADGTPIQC